MKKFIILLIFMFALANKAYSEVIKNIIVKGNERVSKDTIILFSGIKKGQDINNETLNEVIKNLYNTNFFANVRASIDTNNLLISVNENPVVETIEILGIKNKSIIEVLNENIELKAKASFIKSKLKSDRDKIINILRANGFYFSEIETTTQDSDNNTIKIVHNIDLGERAYIKKIKFIGDKKFKDRKLKNVIVSEEAKFWKFISKKKYLDIKRIKLDENLLTNFYKNRGYYNVKINSSSAQIIDQKDFELVFNINAGEKFYFNELTLTTPPNFSKDNFIEIIQVLEKLKGKKYSYGKIQEILSEIDKIALTKEFEFINAKYSEKIINKNQLNLAIKLDETEKLYIERINILGNYITEEKVIRNTLLIDEGDAYNKILLNKSVNNIKSKNIFSSVTSNVKKGSENKKKIIEIEVEEKPTGEISAGAGTGTSGSTVSFGVRENNYLGQGIKLNANLSINETGITGKISTNNPNYRNSDRSLRTTFESSTRDLMSRFGYKNEKIGFSFGTSYEQFKDVYFSPEISNYYESLTTSSTASASKIKQEGDYIDSYFSYGLTLNRLNQNFQPSDGYKSSFYQSLPIYSEDLSIENSYQFSKYHSFENDMVFSYLLFSKAVNALSGDDVRVSKRVFIPTKKLRGFEAGKIGPKDSGDYIGGNYATAINLETNLQNLLPDSSRTEVSLFLDVGNVWGVDYDSSIDESNKLRSSVGSAINWTSPIGPVSFVISQNLSKANTDKTESFNFRLGTTF